MQLTPFQAETSSASARSPERPPSVRYLGFRNTEHGRAYTLRVDAAGVPRMITVTIPHAAFQQRSVRFQDAPDLCFAKLQRALAEQMELPDGLQLVVGMDELASYRDTQSRRSSPERKKRNRPALP